MNKLQTRILDILSTDSRTTADNISVMLGVEVASIKSEIARLESDGVILKYSTIINEEKLDFESVEALIEVKVSPVHSRGFDAIAEEIYKFDEVVSLYLMSGAYDLAVFVKGKSLKQVASFVSERLSVMDKVLSTATHFILKKYKSEGVVMDNDNSSKRLVVHA